MIKSLNTIKTEAFPMNQFNKEILDALSSDSKTSLKDVFRNQLEQTVNTLLQEELSAVLGYQPYERNDSSAHGDNARNGSYQRTIDTEFGPINITVPRDRKNKFRNALFEPYSRRTDTLESMIIKMYSKGITTREIADLVERMYGDYYSPTTVSNITKQVGNLVEEFHNRTFKHSQYVCVFLDATYIPLKRGTVEREAVNIAIGIRSDGGKEVLDFSVAPNENGEAWRELLESLRNRGIEQVQLFIADGFIGLENVIAEIYPTAKFQRCLVHVLRNLTSHVRKSDIRDKDEQKRLAEEGTPEAAKLLKNSRYILMSKRSTLVQKDGDARQGKLVSVPGEIFNKPEIRAHGDNESWYDDLLEENRLFFTIDIVKDLLDQAYSSNDEVEMCVKLEYIIDICIETENSHFKWFARLLQRHLSGIYSFAKYRISTGKLEGINNKIKTERRKGYGYPDDEYFFLRLMELSRKKP